MTLRKVVYHPLERLDLVDVIGQQDLAHDAVFDLASAMLGASSASGVARGWSSVSVNNTTNLITFGDFTMLGRTVDGQGSTANFPAYMAKYINAVGGHGTCSFSTSKALVQAYRTANGELPPTPEDEDYSVATHGAFYPFIYARPVVVEGVAASRRFWDAGAESETTSTVNTRTITTFEFVLHDINSLPAPPASGFPWTRIGGLKSWIDTAGTVSLGSAGVYPYFYFESMLGIAGGGITSLDYSSSGIGGGFGGAISFLMDQIYKIKTDGASDSAGRPLLERGETAPSSLSDLDYRLNNLDVEVSALKLSVSSTLILSLTFPGGDFPTLSYSQLAGNTFNITPFLDYKPAREYLDRIEGATIGAFDAGVWGSHFSGDTNNSHLLTALSLVVPTEYRFKAFSLSIEPIYCDRGGEFVGSGDGELADALHYARIRGSERWFLKASANTPNASKQITTLTRQAIGSSTEIAFNGINIMERSSEDWSIVADNGIRLDLKITLTIHNQ